MAVASNGSGQGWLEGGPESVWDARFEACFDVAVSYLIIDNPEASMRRFRRSTGRKMLLVVRDSHV